MASEGQHDCLFFGQELADADCIFAVMVFVREREPIR